MAKDLKHFMNFEVNFDIDSLSTIHVGTFNSIKHSSEEKLTLYDKKSKSVIRSLVISPQTQLP